MWVKWAAATAIIYNSRKRVDQNQNTASKSKRWPANLQFAANPNRFIFKSLVAFRYFWMNWQLWPVWPLAKLSNIIQPISSTMKGPNLQSDTSAPMKTHTEQTPQLKAFRSWIWVGKKHMKPPVSYHSNKEVLPKKETQSARSFMVEGVHGQVREEPCTMYILPLPDLGKLNMTS